MTSDEKKYKENYENLLAQGVSEEWLKEKYKNDWNKGGFANVENSKMDKILNDYKKYQQTEIQTRIDKLPDEIKNDPSFKNLPIDQQEIVAYNYEIQAEDNKVKQQALADALEMATEQADPYWKNIIRIAQDEVLRAVEEVEGDYKSGVERRQRNIQELKQDLTANKEFLSLEQQAELGRILGDMQASQAEYDRNAKNLGEDRALQLEKINSDYQKQRDDIIRAQGNLDPEKQTALDRAELELNNTKQQIESNVKYTEEEKQAALEQVQAEYDKTVGDTMRQEGFITEEQKATLENLDRNYQVSKQNVAEEVANAGLTFSIKRQEAMSRLKDENQGLVESSQRTFNKQMADLESNLSYVGGQKQAQEGSITRNAVKKVQDLKDALQFAQDMSANETGELKRLYANKAEQLQAELIQAQKEAELATTSVDTATSQREAEIQAGLQEAQRKTAEQKSATEREYSKRIAELEIEAQRGNTEAQAEIEDLQRKLGESITSIGREAEKTLGTENMPDINSIIQNNPVTPVAGTPEPTPVYTPLGDVPGTIAEEKIKDIETRKQTIYDELIANSLNF